MSRARSKLKKQCKPKEPVGYLLESVHVNCASMESEYNTWQYNQPPVCVTDVAHQVIGPQIQQMAARNRTARMEGTREECMGLREFGKEATTVKIKEATDNDYMILNLTRTGAN